MNPYTNANELYAVPGARNIIDMINPHTGRTCINGDTEDQVRAREPQAVRMTLDAWQDEQKARQRTPIVWEDTTATQYNEMLNVLPPAAWIDGAFLVGEPTDHDYNNGQPRFAAYWYRFGCYLVASRPITIKELRAELAR